MVLKVATCTIKLATVARHAEQHCKQLAAGHVMRTRIQSVRTRVEALNPKGLPQLWCILGGMGVRYYHAWPHLVGMACVLSAKPVVV